MFKLSGFGDEISSEIEVQLEVLASEGIRWLELRGVWGKGVLELTREEVGKIKKFLERENFKVSGIASPLGKIKITSEFSSELKRLKKAISLAREFETPYLRLFSYYVSSQEAPLFREEVLRRMEELTRVAEKERIILLCENEGDVYASTPERCLEILKSVDSPHLRLLFDPANFISAGVRPYRDAFPKLVDYIEYLHIKDARFLDGKVLPAGEGEGEIKKILRELKRRNFSGFLSLEPHLIMAKKKSGFSGPELFKRASRALKKILKELEEQKKIS